MNEKLCKKDIKVLSGILLFTAAVMIILLLPSNVYGSTMDWSSQHYAIPEYFRTLFYKTHQLFPSYAANIGGGENIYSLSYYGLYSPVIMLSYLLPFVPMGYYIMMCGVVTVFVSQALFYFYIRRYYAIKTTAFVTLLFTMSVPLVFHSHRHIMFILFLPFLLICFFLTERYFKTGRRAALCFAAFLMIMCNYFFAVSSLAALFCFGVMRVIDERPESFKSFVKRLAPFALTLMVSVLMAGVLLLPTAFTLLSGRDESNTDVSLTSFLPTVRYEWLAYYGYSLGLTGIGVYASLFGAFCLKGGKRFVSVMTLSFAVCPVFVYMLNGTLYFDAKVLFAFLPLALLPCAELVNRYFDKAEPVPLTVLWVFLASCLVSLTVCGFIAQEKFLLADALFVLAGVLLYNKKRDSRPLLIFLIVPLVSFIGWNKFDTLYTTQRYETVNSPDVYTLAGEASSDELARTAVDTEHRDTANKVYSASHYLDTVYSSIHSREYNSFYFNEMLNENEFRNSALTTRSRNLLFNCYMGDKYYVTKTPVTYMGFELIKSEGGYYLYENKNAYPLIYSAHELMSKRQYDKLNYPENIEALMRCTVVERDMPDIAFERHSREIDLSGLFDNAAGKSKNGVIHIEPEGMKQSFKYTLPDDAKGKIILLRFFVDNSGTDLPGFDETGDDIITINGIKNKLTNKNWKYFNNNNYFEYVLSDLKDELDITLTGIAFDISDIQAYTLEANELEEMSAALTPFVPDMAATKGDRIEGNITLEADGFIATSFVYHEGFTVYADGEELTPELIDTAFLGFTLPAGSHRVEIVFTAPYLKAGKVMSLTGVTIYILMIIFDRTKKTGREP